jgi:hypothetical protein
MNTLYQLVKNVNRLFCWLLHFQRQCYALPARIVGMFNNPVHLVLHASQDGNHRFLRDERLLYDSRFRFTMVVLY